MNARMLVQKIVAEFNTKDVYAIAEKSGVKIVYASWFPITIGEFERKTRTIRVNRQASANGESGAELEKKIVAHELGHFYAIDLNLARADEEAFARDFAAELTEKNCERIRNPKSEIRNLPRR